ncbi:MAG TPA: hypothetical protein VFZ04_18785 [Longimicrobiales bacterium]
MSHVDDGELTAYADGAYPVNDPDALRISAHLSACDNCRTRIEQAQMLRDRATEILGYATPATQVAPSFEALQAQVATSSGKPRRYVNLAWAASIMMALGLGWFGRGALQSPPDMRSGSVFEAPAVASDVQSEEAAAPPAAAAAPQISTATRGMQDRPTANPQVDAAANQQARPLERPTIGAVVGSGAVAAAPPPPAPAVAEADFAADAAVEYLSAAEAERRNIAVPRIPELPVARVAIGAGNTVVEQTLHDGKVVRLTFSENVITESVRREQSAPAPARARVAAPELAQAQKSVVPDVTVQVNGRVITITGDLPADSLRALAQKIR